MKKTILSIVDRCVPVAICGLLLAVLAGCESESLEDTYAEYAGEGEVRYVGSVTDLDIRSGWHRLVVNWTNSVDPIIDNVKVTWEKDGVRDSVLLDRTATEYNIVGLEDGNYSVSVQSVDGRGRTSLASTVYGRPYTLQHEAVQSVTQLVSRSFFLHDRLILIFLGWESNIDKAYITFTPKGESRLDTLQLTKQMVAGLYYLKSGEVDTAQPVTLYRSGYIPGCEDYVEFSPVTFDTNRTYNGDFKREMKRQFGFDDDIPDAWADTVSQISFDWNISSFVDLLNFPALKSVVLGKHRYIIDEMINDTEYSQARQAETGLSRFVLKTLYQIQGTYTYRYNKHFSELGTATYIRSAGKTSIPSDILFYNLAASGIFFYDNFYVEGFDNHVEYLVDNDPLTSWEPYTNTLTEAYDMQLICDLGSPQNIIKGLKWVQSYYGSSSTQQRAKIPGSCQIMTSIDGTAWDYATYVEDYTLGQSTGETNLIGFRDGGVQCRYIAIVVTTPIYFYNYAISIAELGLW